MRSIEIAWYNDDSIIIYIIIILNLNYFLKKPAIIKSILGENIKFNRQYIDVKNVMKIYCI